MRRFLIAGAGVLTILAVPALAQPMGGGPGAPGMLFSADANNDGALTRAEFDAGRGARFSQLDADHNGEVAPAEMRAQRESAGRGRHGHHRGQHLQRADANNDGAITRDEFLAQPIAAFERLDANHDGVISSSERPQPGQHGGRGERGRADTDRNGALSRDEFAAMGAEMFDRLDRNDDDRVTREEAAQGRHGMR